jgi:putative transposase
MSQKSSLQGYREILGICEGARRAGVPSSSRGPCRRQADHLRRLPGSESAAEFLPEAAWQRCIVHWYRNIFSHVPSTKVREIAAMLKAIHASEDVVAAREKAIRVIEKLHGFRLIKAAELAEAGSRRP